MHQPGTSQHHTRSIVLPLLYVPQMRDMLELERVLVPRERGPDRGVHRVNVRLVDLHALSSEVRSVVDGDGVQIGVAGPELVEDEEDLDGGTGDKDGEETAATAANNLLNLV
jgi:hypothetical protein